MHEMLRRTLHQQRVDDFMRKAGQELPDRPTVPDEKTRRLRAKLIIEEAFETVRELGFHLVVNGLHDDENVDITDKETFHKHVLMALTEAGPSLEGIADGCADIIVVTTGTLSACGIADESLQREVDVNNIAKFEHRCPKCGRTDQVTHNLNKGDGWVFCTACNTDWQSGHHNEAGKWIKPSNHKPPRVAAVLAEQTKVAELRAAETVRFEAAAAPGNDPPCFGESYTPSSKRCQGCPQPRRKRCIEKYIGG